jgi:hypothetical protein
MTITELALPLPSFRVFRVSGLTFNPFPWLQLGAALPLVLLVVHSRRTVRTERRKEGSEGGGKGGREGRREEGGRGKGGREGWEGGRKLVST